MPFLLDPSIDRLIEQAINPVLHSTFSFTQFRHIPFYSYYSLLLSLPSPPFFALVLMFKHVILYQSTLRIMNNDHDPNQAKPNTDPCSSEKVIGKEEIK